MHVKLYNHTILNYTYNASSQSAQKTYTALLTAGKKYRVSFDFIIDGITTATYTVINGSNTVGTKLQNVTNHEVTEFTATNTNLTLVIELSAGNYGRLAHIDNLEIAEIAEVGESYRFGFNGKEKDQEGMGGGGSTYDYGFRIYNPNLGKFLSVDPLASSFPFYTPYQFAGNKPICSLDLDGLEDIYYMKSFKDKQGDAVIDLMNETSLGKEFLNEFQNKEVNIGYDLFLVTTPLSGAKGETDTYYAPNALLFDSETRTTINAHDAIKKVRENRANGIENSGEIYESIKDNLTEEVLFGDGLGETLSKGRSIIIIRINEERMANISSSDKTESINALSEITKTVGHEIKAHANRMATGAKQLPEKDHIDFQGTPAEGLGNMPGSIGDRYDKQVDDVINKNDE